MCGIAGIIGDGIESDSEGKRLEDALNRLRHRGPDGGGIESGDGWLLGFRRLSILDLSSSGDQPMLTRNRDAAIVFNGEIYNYMELRNKLEKPEEILRSSGDTDVLLHRLYEKGEDALGDLNGMFGFAFLDFRSRKFMLVRDRMGVKPLYYSIRNGKLYFASELDPLLSLLPEQPAIDRLALNRYMQFAHITPPLTIFEGVHKLQPGHLLAGSLDDVSSARLREWWKVQVEVDYSGTAEHWLEEVDHLLADATAIRLRSDVPLGVFLSGGIDSGLVAHYASKAANGDPPDALTVTFDETEYSEAETAAAVAEARGMKHRIVKVVPDSLAELPTIVRHCGEPFFDSSIVNLYFLAKEARKHATVFLSGDGGDESFGGYKEYVNIALNRNKYETVSRLLRWSVPIFSRLLPPGSNLKQRLWKLSSGPGGLGVLVRRNFRDPVFTGMIRPEWQIPASEMERQAWDMWAETGPAPLTSRMQRLDLRSYLEPDVLTKVDRATMAHSIEIRSPFLDYRVVELAARIPPELLLDLEKHQGKKLLRQLAHRHLPPGVFDKPKRGFELPVRKWLRGKLGDEVERMLLDKDSAVCEWLDPLKLRNLLRMNRSSKGRQLHYEVWRVVMLEAWARVMLRGEETLPLAVNSF